jgi:ABC-type nitrate/sulfonate/bicarbonate transport system permease component
VGFASALVLALPLGIVVGSARPVYRSVRLLIDFLRPIPPVAVLPLAVLLYGTGTEMKVYLVAFSAFWPILFQTLYGVQDVDPVARDTVRAYGLGRFAQLWHVVLPSALPYIATGLRLAATIALVVTIATELIVGSQGLGFAINQVRYASDMPAMYALVLIAGMLGLLVSVALRAIERRVLRWHPSQRQEQRP